MGVVYAFDSKRIILIVNLFDSLSLYDGFRVAAGLS